MSGAACSLINAHGNAQRAQDTSLICKHNQIMLLTRGLNHDCSSFSVFLNSWGRKSSYLILHKQREDHSSILVVLGWISDNFHLLETKFPIEINYTKANSHWKNVHMFLNPSKNTGEYLRNIAEWLILLDFPCHNFWHHRTGDQKELKVLQMHAQTHRHALYKQLRTQWLFKLGLASNCAIDIISILRIIKQKQNSKQLVLAYILGKWQRSQNYNPIPFSSLILFF